VAHINFISDLKEVITQKLSRLGHPPASEEDIDTLLIRLLTWRGEYHQLLNGL
jgi:hypothetical protein